MFDKSSDREGSVLALSLSSVFHANPPDQIQEKKVSSQEGNGGSKIGETDKARPGQSVSSLWNFQLLTRMAQPLL